MIRNTVLALVLTPVALLAQPGGSQFPAIFKALDPDFSRTITAEELREVESRLLQLDKDSDGELSSAEIGWPPPGQGGGRFQFPKPPPLEAIDSNRDNRLSKAEIRGAAKALLKLDTNRDGSLSTHETMPRFNGGPPRGGFPGGGGRGFGSGRSSSKRLNPDELEIIDGAPSIKSHAEFQRLSYRGTEVLIDTFLKDLEFVKFTIDRANTDEPQIYFINTNTHRAHMMFAQAAGLPGGRGGGDSQMKGVLVYRPMLKSPSGKAGLFTYEFEPFDSYSHAMVKLAHDVLISKMPLLKGNIGYYPRQRGLDSWLRDKDLYEKNGPPVYREEELINTDIAFLPLNSAVSFGRLRVMGHDERPSARDVVIYKTLPNELSRVAGVITEVRQTPLSHVNLRAVQDKVPNAFITDATTSEQISPLIGRYVRYEVSSDGYNLRAATEKELDAHFDQLRPSRTQRPPRNLKVRDIRTLDDLSFEDSDSVGVKAANVAALRKFKLPEGTVPNGYAIPFHYYNEFMKHNGFYQYAQDLIANPRFQKNADARERALTEFRALIRKGVVPAWMMDTLERMHKSWPADQSLRLRSSTNNEDLPGFSGAGLYDSFTHRPDEGHISKSVKQVFASMWNYRAFEERDFYRVDHMSVAMGILVHPNFKGERANGVAVSDDILYQTAASYYVNAQVGEDLVTNPDEASVPEELVLAWYEEDGDRVMRTSNRNAGKPMLSTVHRNELRKHLGQIHGRFARLYRRDMEDPQFAIEIEFKITKDNRLVIKQARPWVYPAATR